jgi:hypothetical protein
MKSISEGKESDSEVRRMRGGAPPAAHDEHRILMRARQRMTD